MSRLNRVVVAAALAVGVMLPSTGGVVGANPQPAPRGVCTKVGDVVSAPVPLVCKQTTKNGLRWRKVPTTTTTTTTSVAPSTTVAVVPTVSLAATFLDSGTFPKAAVVTSNVAGTVYFIEGASPVSTVSDITSARSYRWTSGVVAANTPTSIGLDVDVLTNGYYRVFVANSQGVLSAPAVNKVTISISRASDVAALSCAAGGVCAVGETGPGGGVVFYVQASGGTFSCGATLASTCRYLEAAPTTGTNSWSDAQYVWSGNTSTLIGSAAQGEGVGTGYKNTEAIVAQSSTANRAGTIARAYRGPNNFSDWYLPSKGELNELYRERVRVGGNSAVSYWSSTEVDANVAWMQHFYNGFQGDDAKSIGTYYVRPVRAFGGTLTCADGGICAVGDTGPGGGVVFYVSASNFTSTGSTCNTACKYLEAAPANWLAGTTGDPPRSWATDTDPGAGKGNQEALVTGANETGIGTGYQNTLDIVAQTGNVAATSAAVEARAYRGNSKTDWHLPSKDELNQMCKWQRGVAWTSDATVCTGGTLNSGLGASGFIAVGYWSSSQDDGDSAWRQRFQDGIEAGTQVTGTKSVTYYMRPVRAF